MAYKSTLLNQAPILSENSLVSESIPSLMITTPNTEPIIEINADLRKITVPQELYNVGVVGDCCAETIYFKCPRYFDGEDLSIHNCIIRCINAKKEYFEDEIVEMIVNDDNLHFGWKLDGRATRYSGVINFTVQFETSNNGCGYQWQTTPAQLNVLAGLNIEETITEKDNTLFRSLSNQVQTLQMQLTNLLSEVESLKTMKNQLDKLILDFENLKENVVYAYDDEN